MHSQKNKYSYVLLTKSVLKQIIHHKIRLRPDADKNKNSPHSFVLPQAEAQTV